MTINDLYQRARGFSDYPSQLSIFRPETESSFLLHYLQDVDAKVEEMDMFFTWWKNTVSSDLLDLTGTVTYTLSPEGITPSYQINTVEVPDYCRGVLWLCDHVQVLLKYHNLINMSDANPHLFVGLRPEYLHRYNDFFHVLRRLLPTLDKRSTLSLVGLVLYRDTEKDRIQMLCSMVEQFRYASLALIRVPNSNEPAPTDNWPLLDEESRLDLHPYNKKKISMRFLTWDCLHESGMVINY